MTLSLNPWIIDTIAMTVMTPTTIPVTVRAERSLWSRIAPSAKRTFSLVPRTLTAVSLAPERLDGGQVRRADRRRDAGDEPHARGHAETDKDEERRDARGKRRHPCGRPRDAGAEEDPDRAPERRHQRGLEQELSEHVPLACPERHPDADLARPFGDGDEHDVRDHDPADDEADPRDEDHDGEQREGDLLV